MFRALSNTGLSYCLKRKRKEDKWRIKLAEIDHSTVHYGTHWDCKNNPQSHADDFSLLTTCGWALVFTSTFIRWRTLSRARLTVSEQACSRVLGSRSDLDRLLACLRLNDGEMDLKLLEKPLSTFMIPGERNSKYCKTHRKWSPYWYMSS